MALIIPGTEIGSGVDSRSQVYKATHNEDGTRRPHMYRSFISFSFGGRWIEDFSLIAVTDGDRLSHAIYADFSDITHDPEVYDGQHYWDTHLKANAWDLTLSTDGITEENLEEFRKWFAPGKIRELILAEHPNRGIMARVSAVPSYSMIPFEYDEEMLVLEQPVNVKTTLYRGDITISFVMDDPYWYSIRNMISSDDIVDAKGYTEEMEEEGKILLCDALKIVQEDKIAFTNMLLTPSQPYGMFYGEIIHFPTLPSGSSVTYPPEVPAIVNGEPEGPTLPQNLLTSREGRVCMYYCGTAPCRPYFEFTFHPRMDIASPYIAFPRNSFATPEIPYSIITFKSENEYLFKFTTPGIYTGYNQALNVLNGIDGTMSWEDVRTLLRDNVKHFAPRAFAMKALDYYRNGSTATTIGDENLSAILALMPNFLYDNQSSYYDARVSFDCKTGRALGHFKYTSIKLQEQQVEDSQGNISHEVTLVYEYNQSLEEDVGDMVKSEYLKLEDRNGPNSKGYIMTWNDEKERHKKLSYTIYMEPENDNSDGIKNFLIYYKNLYY